MCFMLYQFIKKRLDAKKQQKLECSENPSDQAKAQELKASTKGDFQWTPSSYVILLLGFLIMFDYGIVFISIQAYFHELAPGLDRLYGVAFGVYDLATFLGLPFFGWLTNRIGMKNTILFALLFNIGGNVLYSCAMVVHMPSDPTATPGMWELIIVGRFIAGFGASCVALGVADISKRTTYGQRSGVIASYRGIGVVARSVGPMIALPLTRMNMDLTSTVDYLFNFYTIPGWITAGLSLITFFCILFVYENPVEVNPVTGKPLTPEEAQNNSFDKTEASELFENSYWIFGFQGIAAFILVIVSSQLMNIGTAQYQMVSNTNDLWKLYMGFVAAVIPASMILVRLRKNNIGRDTHFVQIAYFAMAIEMILLVQYVKHPSQYLYYAGTFFALFAAVWFNSMLESFWTKKCSQFRFEAGRYYVRFLVILQMSTSLFNFIGSSISSNILYLPTNSLSDFGIMVDVSQANSQAYLESLDNAQAADVCDLSFPQHYFTQGCDLENANIVFPVLAATSLLCFIVFSFVYLPKHKIPAELDASFERGSLHDYDGTEPDNVARDTLSKELEYISKSEA
eukprot:Nk52_evm14s211 gene=Nk52_evmTU14s211